MSRRDGYLLDSHVLLWWWFDPDRLSTAVRELLELSGAFTDLPGLLQADGFEALPISLAHGLRAGGYCQPHRDPFDRMLAAQAELERLVLLTADTHLSSFPCQTLW